MGEKKETLCKMPRGILPVNSNLDSFNKFSLHKYV